VAKAKDKLQMQKMQEREKVKLEIVAEYQAAANNYVSEQIAAAELQMQQEMEKEIAKRIQQANMSKMNPSSMSVNSTFVSFREQYQQRSEMGSQSYLFHEMEDVSDLSNESIDKSFDTMKEARM